MGIQNKIDNSLTGRKPVRLLRFSSMIKKIFQSCPEMGDRFFCDDARGTIVTGRMIFSVSAAGFSDVDSDATVSWAKASIDKMTDAGYIKGYEDGTFRPDQSITRAEAMTMINRVLNRLPAAKEDLLPGMLQWPDNQDPGAWYYLAVQEATNSHTWKEKGEISEQWTELTEAPDWSRYET